MSILDFTSGLFRDPANLRSFVDYPDAREIGEPGDDHAPDDGGVDLDISGVVWGEAVE